MQKITFGQCFRGSWRDAIGGLMAAPILIPCVFGVLILTDLWGSPSGQSASQAATNAGMHAHMSMREALLHIPYACLQLVASVALVVHMTRYSFHRAPIDAGGALTAMAAPPLSVAWSVWRYLRASIALALVPIAAALLIGLVVGLTVFIGVKTHTPFMNRSNLNAIFLVLLVLSFCAMLYAFTRLSMLLCNRALGGRATWAASWRSTRGHFWKIWATHFLTILPIFALMFIGGILLGATRAGESAKVFLLFMSLLQSIGSMILISVSGACSAWLYRRFGMSLSLDSPDTDADGEDIGRSSV